MYKNIMHRWRLPAGKWRFTLPLALLLTVFLDEWVFGARETAWPLIRDDLNLSYDQIGWLIGVPNIVGLVIEPLYGMIADTPRRRWLMLMGGAAYAVFAVLFALSGSFIGLFLMTVGLGSASGALVSVGEAALVDADPTRREQNLARWGVAGSAGMIAGTISLAAGGVIGLGWRGLFVWFGVMAAGVTFALWPFRDRLRGGRETVEDEEDAEPNAGHWARWAILLVFSDFMLDVLFGYLALYFVDVVGIDAGGASLAILVWTGVGILGDLALVPLLERVRGVVYLRWSALATAGVFPLFLLVPGVIPKVILLGILGALNAGWYVVLKAGLYGSLPGQAGRVVIISSGIGALSALTPLALGALAARVSLEPALWLLWIAPFVILFGLPRRRAVIEA